MLVLSACILLILKSLCKKDMYFWITLNLIWVTGLQNFWTLFNSILHLIRPLKTIITHGNVDKEAKNEMWHRQCLVSKQITVVTSTQCLGYYANLEVLGCWTVPISALGWRSGVTAWRGCSATGPVLFLAIWLFKLGLLKWKRKR